MADDDLQRFLERVRHSGIDVRFERKRRLWAAHFDEERAHAAGLLEWYEEDGLDDPEEVAQQESAVAENERWLAAVESTSNGIVPLGFPYDWEAPITSGDGSLEALRELFRSTIQESLFSPHFANARDVGAAMLAIYNEFEQNRLDAENDEWLEVQVRKHGLSSHWQGFDDPIEPTELLAQFEAQASAFEQSGDDSGWIEVETLLEGLRREEQVFRRLLEDHGLRRTKWTPKQPEDFAPPARDRPSVQPLEYANKSGRNEPHANPHRRAIALDAIGRLVAELQTIQTTDPLERQEKVRGIKRRIKAARREAGFRGETHSRKHKG